MATLICTLKLNISPFFSTPKKSSILPSLKWNPIFTKPHKFSAPKMVFGSGFWDRGSSFRPNSSSSSSFDNVDKKNGRIMVDTCLVIPPPNNRKPRAIIKFLGGAFIGKVSHVTYSYLIELLAKDGYLVVLVPYNVTFNHEDAARQVYERFNTCLDILLSSGLSDAKLDASQLVGLPVFSVGHSNGALLQVLTASYFFDKIPKANAVLSFNNRSATEAVPYFEQLGPLLSQVMPMVETNPAYSMATSVSGDAWKALVDGAGAVISQTDAELASSVTQFVDQLPSVFDEVRQGVSEFRPTPAENRDRCKYSYSVPNTLLVKFSFDTIDETDLLEETLKTRVNSIGGTLEKVQLSGNHLTPCIQDPKWQVGDRYTPVDAVAQGLKTVSLNDTKVLAKTISNWFRRFEE
ncbi:Phospholipase YtpA [Bienertia sinuspersici]